VCVGRSMRERGGKEVVLASICVGAENRRKTTPHPTTKLTSPRASSAGRWPRPAWAAAAPPCAYRRCASCFFSFCARGAERGGRARARRERAECVSRLGEAHRACARSGEGVGVGNGAVAAAGEQRARRRLSMCLVRKGPPGPARVHTKKKTPSAADKDGARAVFAFRLSEVRAVECPPTSPARPLPPTSCANAVS
jgi:hypothetical protein